ncbi:MAG: hypothetical protein R6U96_12655 [Promethearchaeia archaeon]
MPVDYETAVYNLMEAEPAIIAVAIVKGKDIVYSTDNWDISNDLSQVLSSWNSMNAQFIKISGVKYSMLQCTVERITATSLKGEGHIVGAKDEEHKVISYVEAEGDMRTAYPETARCLSSLSSKGPYMDANTQLGSGEEGGGAATAGGGASNVDPQLKSEIEAFLEWINSKDGLPGYIKYYLEQNDSQVISQLAEVYNELRGIFGV